jgi:alpha-L-fucosidase
MKASASAVFENQAQYDASKAIDGDSDTRWATPAGTSECSLEIDLLEPTTFSRIEIEEACGDRVQKFELQYEKDGAWTTFHEGTTLGAHFNATFPAVTASKVRLHVLEASEGPTISEVRLFAPGK